MSDQQIVIADNGPYMVSGSVPLARKHAVKTERGEPLTWRNPDPIETKDRYALCRCGQSGNKPFCDGTHARVGFDGTETEQGAYDERRKRLGGDGIEVFDDRSICEHAGFCGNEATNVWAMVAETGDTQVRSQIIGMIERCPSGALTYAVDGAGVEPDLPVEISVVADGPLWVTGGLRVERSDGAMLETRNRVTLCRCGASSNKPLCDGSHAEVGFTG